MKRIAWPVLFLAFCLAGRAEHKQVVRIDENVYRGREPKAADFVKLHDMGIKSVLDLRGGMIHKPHERKLVEAAGMHYFSIRLSGIWAPKKRQIAEILAYMDDPNNLPVFVHCRRGYDRVGMVIASYRIAHDHWTNRQALAEANRNGLNRFELLMKLYIRNFDPSKLPAVSPPKTTIP